MNSAAKRFVFLVCVLSCVATSCTDDFSRFQFGQKKPAKTRDAGPQNMSDATGNDPDGAAGAAASQSE
jgi:hypothetical protein